MMWLLIGGAVALALWVAVGLDDARAAREARREQAGPPRRGRTARHTIPRQRQGGDQ